MADFASRLRQARSKAGLSMRALEWQSGVDRGLLSRYESGEVQSPRARNVKRIAEALGVTVDWMMG